LKRRQGLKRLEQRFLGEIIRIAPVARKRVGKAADRGKVRPDKLRKRTRVATLSSLEQVSIQSAHNPVCGWTRSGP
jgi:hypothetical protein